MHCWSLKHVGFRSFRRIKLWCEQKSVFKFEACSVRWKCVEKNKLDAFLQNLFLNIPSGVIDGCVRKVNTAFRQIFVFAPKRFILRLDSVFWKTRRNTIPSFSVNDTSRYFTFFLVFKIGGFQWVTIDLYTTSAILQFWSLSLKFTIYHRCGHKAHDLCTQRFDLRTNSCPSHLSSQLSDLFVQSFHGF